MAISKLFQVRQKTSNCPAHSVCSAGSAQKAIYIKPKKNMPCIVYKNICNELRTKPETIQAGLTGQGGEKSNFMSYFVEQSSDSPIPLKFYLSPATFPDPALGKA